MKVELRHTKNRWPANILCLTGENLNENNLLARLEKAFKEPFETLTLEWPDRSSSSSAGDRIRLSTKRTFSKEEL
jgi:hypothetical protein